MDSNLISAITLCHWLGDFFCSGMLMEQLVEGSCRESKQSQGGQRWDENVLCKVQSYWWKYPLLCFLKMFMIPARRLTWKSTCATARGTSATKEQLLVQQTQICSGALCHRSSFNPWCDVYRILFLKTSYVSLMYKSRIVLKIFTSPFLSYTLPQRGKISNIKKSQTKPMYKIWIILWVFLSQPYTPLCCISFI